MVEHNINDPELNQFLAIKSAIVSVDYQQRRRFLWHNIKDRYPRFLYKFRAYGLSDDVSIDRLRDLIVRSRFWLSSPLDFNDPFDMSASMIAGGSVKEKRQRMDQILKLEGKSWSQRQKMLPKLAAQSNEDLARLAQSEHEKNVAQAGVYSFGGDPRSILMRSHYSANHEGVCLQFEFARDPDCFMNSVSVKYSKDYPVINWMNEDAYSRGIEAALERKHVDWKYEKETRIVLPGRANQYLPFRSCALRAVIFGCRIKEASLRMILDLIAERMTTGKPPVALYRAFKHQEKYELVIKRDFADHSG